MALLNRTLAPAQPKTAGVGTRLGLMPLVLLAAGAVIVLGLLRVVQTSQATSASFAMQTLQQDKLELETSVRQLEAEVASLSSIDRIEREAARLGLEQPASVSYAKVDAVWPAAADDLLPARFAPETEEGVAMAEASADDASPDDAAIAGADGSAEDQGRWQKLLKFLPFN